MAYSQYVVSESGNSFVSIHFIATSFLLNEILSYEHISITSEQSKLQISNFNCIHSLPKTSYRLIILTSWFTLAETCSEERTKQKFLQ
jgi:hypothetical protein